jgi:hypothetical protein
VEDNYPKNLPDFCDVHVPFSISVLCCTRWCGSLWFVQKVEENKLKNLLQDNYPKNLPDFLSYRCLFLFLCFVVQGE